MLHVTIALALSIHGTPSSEPVYETQFIFPAESLHNHSPSIVETRDGDLLACWFHGRGEKGDDTLVIRGARKRRGDSEWSKPFIMADNQNLPDQNCVLFIDPQDTLWLFWISSLDNTIGTYLLKYRKSSDYAKDGAPLWNWQDVIHCRPRNLEALYAQHDARMRRQFATQLPKETRLRSRMDAGLAASHDKLMRRLGWMTRTHPLMLTPNRMMLPLYSDQFYCGLAAFTEDGGLTWSFSEPIFALCIQPSFVRKENGDIVAFMRERSPLRRIQRSVSSDGGMTWSSAEPMNIPNPGSSVECIQLKNGNWLMACNDKSGGPRKGRTRLSVYLSDDEGATWKWQRIVEDHDGGTAASYPSLIQSSDGTVHLAFTFSPTPHETIKHVRLNEAWIRAARE